MFTLTERPATTHIELSCPTADEPFTRPFSFAVSDWIDRIGTSRAILWTISHSSFKQWTADGRLAHFAPNTFPAESDLSADGFVFDGWVPKDPLREALAEGSDVGQWVALGVTLLLVIGLFLFLLIADVLKRKSPAELHDGAMESDSLSPAVSSGRCDIRPTAVLAP
jgi:hypothetical protein